MSSINTIKCVLISISLNNNESHISLNTTYEAVEYYWVKSVWLRLGNTRVYVREHQALDANGIDEVMIATVKRYIRYAL